MRRGAARKTPLKGGAAPGRSGAGDEHVVLFVHALNDRAIADIACALAGQMVPLVGRVTLLATHVSRGGDFPEGVEVQDLRGGGRRTLWSLRALAGELRLLEADVVFAHGNGPARAAVLATAGMGPRRPTVIAVEHNHYSSYDWTLPRLRRLVNAFLLPRADAVIGVSRGVVDDLVRTFPRLSDRVSVIGEPLTRWDRLEELAAEAVDHPWFHNGPPPIVSVFNIHERKDPATLVRALARLRAGGRLPCPRLVLIGRHSSSGLVARLRELAVELGVDDAVDLAGFRENPLAYVARAGAFAFASFNEGMGLAILEAMALGVPVVATDCPSGPDWLLSGGENGLLVPMEDDVAVADALERCLTDAELRRGFVEAGLRRAREFAPSAIARAHLALAGIATPPRAGRVRHGRGDQPPTVSCPPSTTRV